MLGLCKATDEPRSTASYKWLSNEILINPESLLHVPQRHLLGAGELVCQAADQLAGKAEMRPPSPPIISEDLPTAHPFLVMLANGLFDVAARDEPCSGRGSSNANDRR